MIQRFFFNLLVGRPSVHEIMCFYLFVLVPSNRRLGVENGAERRPPPGIQAQRPAPAHRTHDTTDQWREIFLRLGRSAAYFPSIHRSPKNTSRVSGMMSFILARFYNGFLVDQAWPLSKNKGFVNFIFKSVARNAVRLLKY